MSRPTVPNIQNQSSSWDATINLFKDVVLNGPIPLPIHSGEGTLTATYPPAAHDRCFVMVDHSVFGWTLYVSDGTQWRPYTSYTKRLHRTAASTQAFTATDDLVECTGAGSFNLTLGTAASRAAETITVKNSAAAAVTIFASGAETLDGAASQSLAAGASVGLYSTGTYWLRV